MKMKSLPVVMAIAVVAVLAMSTIGSVYAASSPTPTFPGDWTTGTNFQLADGGLKWSSLATRSSDFRTAYTPLMWDDDDYYLVYKIRFTTWDTTVGTRLFIGLRWNTVSTSANGEIVDNAALSIDFWTQTANKRTVRFSGQSTVCTSHGELTLSPNTDYYFHAKREGNVETLKITSGSIDGTVLKQATGTISGDKRPANYLQIGNQNTASSQYAYYMFGTLHDVTPDLPSWKKYHSVTSQMTSEPAPQWYKYHAMTSTIGVEAYQWLKYQSVQSTSEVVEYGYELYHKMASRINSFSELMHTSTIIVTLIILFVPSLVAYAVIGRYGLIFVLSAMTAVMVLNDPSMIITGFIVWATATVIIWRGYR